MNTNHLHFSNRFWTVIMKVVVINLLSCNYEGNGNKIYWTVIMKVVVIKLFSCNYEGSSNKII